MYKIIEKRKLGSVSKAPNPTSTTQVVSVGEEDDVEQIKFIWCNHDISLLYCVPQHNH